MSEDYDYTVYMTGRPYACNCTAPDCQQADGITKTCTKAINNLRKRMESYTVHKGQFTP
jgi:hypothetical protein